MLVGHGCRALRVPCGSGRAREESSAEPGTGCAGVRGPARSHRVRVALTKPVIFQRRL